MVKERSFQCQYQHAVMLNIKGDFIIEFNGIRVWNKL